MPECVSAAASIVSDMTAVHGPGGARVELSARQREVVESAAPLLAVVGAAGSGKSATLVEKVAALVAAGAAAEEVLVLSPTRESARSLREQLDTRLGVVRSGPSARTPQSFAFEVVRHSYLSQGRTPPRLLTGGEQEALISDILDGENALGRVPAWPESIDASIRALAGFRHELRDVIDQCSQWGVRPAQLRESGRKEWVAVADFIDEYRAVVATLDPLPLTAAELMAEATRLVETQTGWPAEFPALRHIVVDDIQEFTPQGARLLRAVVGSGATLATFGDPDTATNEFRGGSPELVAGLVRDIDPSAPLIELTVSYRTRGAIGRVMHAVTGMIGSARAGGQRKAWVPPQLREGPADVLAATCASVSMEAMAIARELRRRHVVDGVPWSECAVVVRSSAQAEAVARAVEAEGVPVRASGRPQLFREHPATFPLLLAGSIATGVRVPSSADYETLLLSFLGDMDVVQLRRLRRELRREELAAGGSRSAADLLVEAFQAQAGFASLGPVARAAQSLATMLNRATAAAEGDSAVQVLWRLWDAGRVDGVPVAQSWQRRVLAAGEDASAMSRNLDAVVALFATASRFTEHAPDAPASEFFAEQWRRRVADDVITPAVSRDAVWVGTAAQLVSRSFDTVVIAGLQQGVWPDMRLRDTLLGARRISRGGERHAPEDERREVLHSELRLFARAVSSARRRLVVTAVDSEDDTASALFQIVAAEQTEPWHPESVGHSYTLRSLAAQLRRELDTSDDQDAINALALMSREGVSAADPRRWHGLLAVSSAEGIREMSPDEPVRVSPSGVESFDTCGLGWFLDRYRGREGAVSAGVGTIVHAAFERAGDDASVESLAQIVDDGWTNLTFDVDWESRWRRSKVQGMLEKLISYLDHVRAEQRRRVAAEIDFCVEGESFVLPGTIDRIEVDSDNRVHIIDLKTSRNAITRDEAKTNPQLMSYQLAVLDGLPGSSADAAVQDRIVGLELAQAGLLYVGTSAKGYVVRIQEPLTTGQRAAFRAHLHEVAEGMSAAEFVARLESHCVSTGYAPCRIHLVPAVTE